METGFTNMVSHSLAYKFDNLIDFDWLVLLLFYLQNDFFNTVCRFELLQNDIFKSNKEYFL